MKKAHNNDYPHVMLFLSIVDRNGNGKMESSEVELIESASGNDNPTVDEDVQNGGVLNNGIYTRYYRVMNKNLLSSYLHNPWYWLDGNVPDNDDFNTKFTFGRLAYY